MDANKREQEAQVLFKEEAYQIVSCAFDVLNGIGHGFFEKVYEQGLAAEFDLRKIPYSQQEKFGITYKGRVLGEYIPDLTAFGKIIVEIKTIDRITNVERGQVLNYLRVTGHQLGIILNFKKPKLEWERVVLSNV